MSSECEITIINYIVDLSTFFSLLLYVVPWILDLFVISSKVSYLANCKFHFLRQNTCYVASVAGL